MVKERIYVVICCSTNFNTIRHVDKIHRINFRHFEIPQICSQNNINYDISIYYVIENKKFLTKLETFPFRYSTYLKFGNARAREPYGVWLFFSAIRKIQFSSYHFASYLI
jgi:hypothetical protein